MAKRRYDPATRIILASEWSHDLSHRLHALEYCFKRQGSYYETCATPKRPHHVIVLKSTISLAFTRQSRKSITSRPGSYDQAVSGSIIVLLDNFWAEIGPNVLFFLI